MSLLDKLKETQFTPRTVDGVGAVRIRHIKTSEMLKLVDEPDKNAAMRGLIAACIYEGDDKLFSSADDVNTLDWTATRALADAAHDVNKLSRKDAEKNSQDHPPSSP
jgi:hypothetical protein